MRRSVHLPVEESDAASNFGRISLGQAFHLNLSAFVSFKPFDSFELADRLTVSDFSIPKSPTLSLIVTLSP